MSYNGTGIYTLPGAQLINGEVVSATENNQFRNDVATALNTAWTRDGQAPATNNIPMANHKFTGLLPGTENGDSVRYEQVTSDVDITGGTITGVTLTNPVYDGTLTGGTGIINIGSGQIYKKESGYVGIGTNNPNNPLVVSGVIESQSGGYVFPDGTLQDTAAQLPEWHTFTSTTTYTIPVGITKIRGYAFGAGADGGGSEYAVVDAYGGGGGGCAFGDIDVTPGDVVTLTISGGIATVSIGGTNYLVANPGVLTVGGSATKDVSVTNGGAYSGGNGGAGIYGSGGGSSGSPLGNGYNGASATGTTGYQCGGGGAGGAGSIYGGGGGAGGAGIISGGGAGGPALSGMSGTSPGPGRYVNNLFTDPLMVMCISPGGDQGQTAGNGGGGGGSAAGYSIKAGNGGAFGGGGGSDGTATGGYGYAFGGNGGFGGGGGGAQSYTPYNVPAYGGDGGYGGGGGGGFGGSGFAHLGNPGSGGPAIILLYV